MKLQFQQQTKIYLLLIYIILNSNLSIVLLSKTIFQMQSELIYVGLIILWLPIIDASPCSFPDCRLQTFIFCRWGDVGEWEKANLGARSVPATYKFHYDFLIYCAAETFSPCNQMSSAVWFKEWDRKQMEKRNFNQQQIC